MKKVMIVATLLALASLAWGINTPIIDPEDLSLKAGPTEPGEKVSLVWLESYVYPKSVEEERIISLGVTATSKIKSVVASFDFGSNKVELTSSDNMHWTGAYRIPQSIAAGLHVARYEIRGRRGSINRTVEFFIEEPLDYSSKEKSVIQGDAVHVKSWPLTVTSNCSALVGSSTRTLHAGEKVVGFSKVPWYKVVFADGEEGWVSAVNVEEPLEEYYLRGYKAYVDKNFKAAIEYYQNTVAIDPDFVKGHYWLAKSYYRKGDIDAAFRSLNEVLRIDERNIDARVFASVLARKYFDIARKKLRARRYNEAVVAYQKLLRLKPDSALSWIELGKCYDELNLPLEARSAWREAFKIEPENKEIHAMLNIDFGRTDVAQVDKKEAVAKAPVKKAPKEVLVESPPPQDLPPLIVDDSLEIVKKGNTNKGTRIEAALKSVIALAKSLGTPVVEKGWQAQKQGNKFLVRYLYEQGAGAVEAFEWLVDIDTRRVNASNDNSKLLMDRW